MWYRLREGKSSTEAANHMQIFKILWQWIKGNLMYDLLKSIYGLVIGTAGFAWLMDYLNQPITGTIAAWLLCTYGVAFIIYLLLNRLRQKLVPVIEIVHPINGAKIELSQVVFGNVNPPNSFVQLFIYSRDKLWYAKQPDVTGNGWATKCEVGSNTAPIGTEYKIIAIAGAERIDPHKPVSNPPRGQSSSREIIVYRK